eukprot:2534939-Amphidinium_carterae.1
MMPAPWAGMATCKRRFECHTFALPATYVAAIDRHVSEVGEFLRPNQDSLIMADWARPEVMEGASLQSSLNKSIVLREAVVCAHLHSKRALQCR